MLLKYICKSVSIFLRHGAKLTIAVGSPTGSTSLPSHAHTPGTGSTSALLLTLVLSNLTMASTDQSLLDLTDKETREKLSLWDRRTDATAPLTEKQMDSVLEIRAAAEKLSVPSEVSWSSGLC